ncbi:Serine/threonine protein phosphatase PrpC [Ruminococcaceae bacterium FB2012]|nr:Serine/threonine protein phosphatase PrpC [Ruminococcaceae bacterium FB2012]
MSDYETASRSLLGARDEQQDSFLLTEQGGVLLAAVCDGMGGHSGGAQASQLAVKLLRESFEKLLPDNIPAFFIRTAEKMNKAVYDISGLDGKRLGAGSTVVAAAVKDGGLYWLSIGDSRLYLHRAGRLTQITEDHNYLMQLDEQLKSGAITRQNYEAELHKSQALISCLGMKKLGRVHMNVKPLPLMSGDTLLLMSDGLYKSADADSIERCILPTAKRTAAALERLTLESGAKLDNTTFIAVKI